MCISDGIVTAFDSQFYQVLGSIPDSKGCQLFSIYEKQDSIIIVNKKKLFQYGWQRPGFVLRKEFNLSDIPKSITHIKGTAIIGYKKYYETLDLSTGTSNRLLDVEKEHKMVVVELASSVLRGDSVLLSVGQVGLLLDEEQVLTGNYITPLGSKISRIEWSNLPLSINIMTPFILTPLIDCSLEVHDLLTLVPLQKINCISSNPSSSLSLTVCCEDQLKAVATSSPFLFHSMVCNGEQLLSMRMTPLLNQVNTLIAQGLYEEAIHLVTLCHLGDLQGVDVVQLHVSCGHALLARGDFQQAITHFIHANTPFLSIAKEFPDFIPLSLQVMLGVNQVKKLTGSILARAALAIVAWGEHHRAKVSYCGGWKVEWGGGGGKGLGR